MEFWKKLFKRNPSEKTDIQKLGKLSVLGMELDLNAMAQEAYAQHEADIKAGIPHIPPDPRFEFNTENAFLLLDVYPFYDKAPADWLPYIDTIRRKTEWIELGFPVVHFPNSPSIMPILIDGFCYGYREYFRLSELQKEAYLTGKKITDSKKAIKILIKRGCKPEEFLIKKE